MFEVYRGSEKIASLTGSKFWAVDDLNPDCRLVMALVQLGVPQEQVTPDRLDFWRVQADDPDFVAALTRHLSPFGLEVRTRSKKES